MCRMHTALRGLLVGGVVAAVIVGSWGLVFAPEAADARERDTFELTLGEEPVEMENFLRAVAQATGVQLIWNPQDKNIRGKKIIGGLDLNAPRDEFMDLVRSVLVFYELVMIPVGPEENGVILILDARQTSSILKLKPIHVKLNDQNLGRFENADGLFITTTIKVEHMEDLRNARNALTRIVTGQNIGNVTEVPGAKAFVITDFAPNVCAIYRLLREMDVPSSNSSTTSGRTVSLSLEHAQAHELATVLANHFRSMPTGPQNPRAPQMASPRAPRITAEPRTNKILVTGNEEQISKVKDVITMMDVPVMQTSVAAHYVRLKYVSAEEAAGTLSSFISRSSALFLQAGAQGLPTVVAHEENNALLISASRTGFEQIARLISEMDQEKKKPSSK